MRIPVNTHQPPDTVEDIDAELRLAATDPSKGKDHARWVAWMAELLDRRLNVEPVTENQRAWLEQKFPTPSG